MSSNSKQSKQGNPAARPTRRTKKPSAPELSPFVARAVAYAQQVLSGEELACRWIKLAAKRFISDLERTDLVLNQDAADRACKFIERLPHIKGRWAKARENIRLEDWQVFIVVNAFGFYWAETGLRRFKTIYIEVGRKNAKSTLSAGIALYGLTLDGEEGPEVYSAATTRDQAKIVFEVAKAMAQRASGFCAALGVEVRVHEIKSEDNSGKFEPLSAEASTMDGLNIHMAIVDELHAHKTRHVWDVLETATGSRENPMIVAITTAGTDRAGVCYEQRGYVLKLLQGLERDDSYFGVVYTLDDGDDWTDESVWGKANPNLGVSVLIDDLRRLATKAKASLSSQAAFLTKRMNIWVTSESAWMDMEKWDACADPSLSLELFEGEDCIDGLDLASKTDIAVDAKLFRRGGDYYLFAQYWLPEEAAHPDKATCSQYDGWAREGRLRLTPGAVTDYDEIEDVLADDAARFNSLELAYDPYQATHLVTRLMKRGLNPVELRPTVLNFSDAMKELERLVLSKRLHHSGDPVLGWMISNVVAYRDHKDNIYPRKERDELKIDAAVAAIMAIKRWMDLDRADGGGESVYDSDDWEEDGQEGADETTGQANPLPKDAGHNPGQRRTSAADDFNEEEVDVESLIGATTLPSDGGGRRWAGSSVYEDWDDL